MRDISGYERLYGITSCGRVWSYRAKKFLNPGKDRYGYLYVNLYKNGKRKTYRIHRLVAETYLPNPLNLPQVNHKDEDKSNNALPNLEWCTAAYNVNYSQAKKVQCIEINEVFDSITKAAKAVDVDRGNISRCCKGQRKTAGGYHWKYYEENEKEED